MKKFLRHLEGLFSANLSIIKLVFAIFKLEVRLAGLSIFPALMNLCVLLMIGMTLWLSMMVLLGLAVLHWFPAPIHAVAVVLVFNLVLFLLFFRFLLLNIRKMSFEKTRQWFSQPPDPNDERYHDVAKTNYHSADTDGKNSGVSEA